MQDDLAERLGRAAAHGPGTPGWAEETRASVTLSADAARLQAAATALAAAPHAGRATSPVPAPLR